MGHFVGKEALAAVGGTTGTLINLLVGFFVGLSSGATVIISQFYGAKQDSRVSHAVHTAIAFAIAGGFVLMLIGFFGAPLALRAMGTPDDIMEYALVYIRIYFLGTIANLIYNMGAGILRAVGDSKRPLYFLMASCLTNIVLDIVLVVGFHMNVMGAAIATISSQAVSAILVIVVLTRTSDSYKLIFRKLKLHYVLVARIVRIGLPAGLQSVMYSLSNIIIQSSINSLGTDTIAAWTAYGKIDTIYWMIINAFGISITTFAGQNFGAGKYDRVRKGIRVCLGISMGATIALSLFLYFFGFYIFRLFTSDPAVLEIGLQMIHFLVPMFFTYICIEILSGGLRGVGDCWIPMIMTGLGVCVLRVLWVIFAVPYNRTMIMVAASYPITWTITSVLFVIYYVKFSKMRKYR